jgi:flagellar motility protein MotE (MotC chaperone)
VELSVNKIDAHEEENIARLAEVCSKMEPQSAVEMLRNMNKDRAAKIINLITERQAAKIMDAAVASQEDGAKLASDWADLIRKMNGQASAGGGAP